QPLLSSAGSSLRCLLGLLGLLGLLSLRLGMLVADVCCQTLRSGSHELAFRASQLRFRPFAGAAGPGPWSRLGALHLRGGRYRSSVGGFGAGKRLERSVYLGKPFFQLLSLLSQQTLSVLQSGSHLAASL